jgi:hypothetical protein
MIRSLMELVWGNRLLRLMVLVILLLTVYAVGFVQGRSADSATVAAVAAAGRTGHSDTASTPDTHAEQAASASAQRGGMGVGATDEPGIPGPNPAGSPTSGAAELSASGSSTASAGLAELQAKLHLDGLGLAYVPVSGTATVQYGSWTSGPAWSTMKVPVAIAALDQSGYQSKGTQQLVHTAIRNSDNAAADKLWDQLGRGFLAASAVDQVLRSQGDLATATQSIVLRPGFSAFGQTDWALTSQVTFAKNLFCGSATSLVYADMGKISADQRWGLGQIPGAHFKGGWGPDPHGKYLVRQFGVVTINGRDVAVALAVRPHDGSFDSGTNALSKVTAWLVDNGERLPQLASKAGLGSGACRA